MKPTKLFIACAITLAVAPGSWLAAQVQTNVPEVVPGAKPVAVEHIKIHGTALEGNLEGDAVDRDVIVFLPPSYQKDKKRRYPVVYALHGYSIGAEQWTHEIHVPQTVEGAFALGLAGDDRRPARFQNRLQRLDVLKLGHHRRLREVHMARRCVLHRRALSHHPRSHQPRSCRPLHGRLWCVAHRHEAS